MAIAFVDADSIDPVRIDDSCYAGDLCRPIRDWSRSKSMRPSHRTVRRASACRGRAGRRRRP
ncbi:hypothetical protein [Streptomyces sp. NPDC014622]|uniref:hypothetical protein n=1 Tax=Streptomyces sp. NPDC014622 TaxID=3364874 RepID=UPI0036F791D3